MRTTHGSDLRSPVPSEPNPAVGGQPGPGDRVGEYILEEKIGVGGCGVVWRARHAVLPRVVVALKLPRDPLLIDVLRRESLVQHGLEHPGIVAVYGVDLEGPVPYLAQEYIPGGDLAHLLAREGRLPVARALSIFCEAVDIVRFAHSRGVVHNDLKPGNILLDAEGHVRIGDFGLGRGIDVAAQTFASISPAKTGEFLWGTWEYMSPEQRDPARRSPDDPSNDIYALGIILYEMIRGERPAGRVDLQDVSPAIDAIFARSWTSRERRYRNAGELWNALDAARSRRAQSRSGRIEARRRARRLARRPSRLRWLAWGFVLGMSAVIALVGWQSAHEAWPFLPSTSRAPTVAVAGARSSRDEADALREIRERIETQPTTVAEALHWLREYRARAQDAVLADLARTWEELLPKTTTPAHYDVHWRAFAIDAEKYRHEVLGVFEPGRPDVYLRVWRERGEKRDLVFDTRARPVEAWSHEWPHDAAPSFDLEWAPGDRLIVDLFDRDRFGDDRLEHMELEGELSLFLLAAARTGPSGHSIELETNQGFR